MHLGSNLCFLFSDRLEMTEPGGGDSRKKGAGTLVGNFELNPTGDQSGRGSTFFKAPKREN